MPTARELLEQADALMRRNRGTGVDIPVLTEAVPEPHAAAEMRAEIPVLTDQVEEVFVDAVPVPAQPPVLELVSRPQFEGDPSDWLVMDTIDPALHSVTGKAPDTLAVVPPVTLKAVETATDAEPRSSVTLKAAGSQPTPPPAGSGTVQPSQPALADAPLAAGASAETHLAEMPLDEAPLSEAPLVEASLPQPVLDSRAAPSVAVSPSDDERWRTLADQISMQVLQRIDLFTDTGLKEQLAQHLQPIVARAGAELVGAINDHVGKLLRAYVAEAIEREIAQWRKDHD
ncbi:MAG TPA: hypothetical protein VEN29_13530 [Casimicrobiaceae bacterium]|nr:hypothetical protein [Casimicrobiaceae bacterium]